MKELLPEGNLYLFTAYMKVDVLPLPIWHTLAIFLNKNCVAQQYIV